MISNILVISLGLAAVAPLAAMGQQKPMPPGQIRQAPQPNNGPEGQEELPPDKRVFGVLPNYRTADANVPYHPLTSKQKLAIATKDSFDYPLFGLSAIYAGMYQLSDTHPQFGQGTAGYFRRYGTSYADLVIGTFLSEGVMPIAFREDPRYFRLGAASGTSLKHRIWYAATRIVVTRTDAGGSSINYAELLGSGMTAGIGLSYYSDSRNAGDYMRSVGAGLATDAFSQVLKEIWPDVKQWYQNKHRKHDND